MNKAFKAIIKRELAGYLFSPLSFIFLVIFLIFQAGLTFIVGNFYGSNSANLNIFFNIHPWIYLFFIPAIGMRLWAEEEKNGTLEILFTSPVSIFHLVFAKFTASWLFMLFALFLTFPVVLTVYYLGAPDFGPIFSSYLISWLMAGAFLSITVFTSSLSQNQVISFVLSVIICFVFVLLGYGVFSNYLTFLPPSARDFISSFGFIFHIKSAIAGVIDTRDLLYFLSIILFFLSLNINILERKRSK